jgi:HK97 family phage portal protein
MGILKEIGSAISKGVINYANTFSNHSSVQGGLIPYSWSYKKINDSTLTSFGYATNSDVYSVVSMIAYKMSEIPVDVLKLGFKGGYEVDIDSDVYNLLHNDLKETFKDKIIKSAINLNLTGDLFLEKVFVSSEEFPDYLKVLRSSDTYLETDGYGNVTRVNYRDYNLTRYIPYNNIIHVKLYDPTSSNDLRGLSPLQAGYKVLDASNDLQTAASNLYKNMGASWLVSDNTGILRTADEAKDLQDSLNKRVGGASKAGQVTVTGVDATVHQIGMSSKDLELMKSQPIKLRQMCSLYGVDSSFFNDPESSTYNNRKVAEKAFLNNAVKPKLEIILKAIEQDINRVRTIKIRPIYDGLDCLQEDQKEMADKNKVVSESITALLISETLPAQKIFMLISVWGYEEEEAKKLVNGK